MLRSLPLSLTLRLTLTLTTTLVAGSCQDEGLQELYPAISVCTAAGLPSSACDRPIDLGEIPVTVAVPITIYVRNRGGAELELDAVTSSDPVLTIPKTPDVVLPGRDVELPLVVELPPEGLGARTITLTFASNDPKIPLHSVELLLVGVPKPAPDIVVCTEDETTCGTEISASFGTVRRTQQQGLALVVKNVGTAPLNIQAVRSVSETSAADEITVTTSTRPAQLDAGDSAPLVVAYRPADGGADRLTLVIESDDEDTPEATIELTGDAAENAPPVAAAVEVLSQSAAAEAIVDDVVQVDGAHSNDPEGDPLVYEWTLVAPVGSAAALDDPASMRPTFVPDRAGIHTLQLVVRDSLGQASDAATLSIQVRPRFGFRAQLTWTEGGDLDLHLVERGSALFGDRDCGFEHRTLEAGLSATPEDDCLLLEDAETAPGMEQAVIATPAAGTWEIWVHVFDGQGLSALEANVQVVLDDAAPALLQVRQLPGTCSTWHVADISFPDADITVVDGAFGTQCR